MQGQSSYNAWAIAELILSPSIPEHYEGLTIIFVIPLPQQILTPMPEHSAMVYIFIVAMLDPSALNEESRKQDLQRNHTDIGRTGAAKENY